MLRTLRMLLVAHPERVTGEMIEAMWRGAAMPHAREGWRTLLESCNPLSGFRERYLLAPLVPRIGAPTLWLWGARDGYVPTETGRALAASMKDAKFVEVPEAGHLAWLDQPAAIREAIEAFVARPKLGTRTA